MLGVIITLLGLGLLVIAHELGHMLVALALGVRVKEFSVGFGPPLFTRRIGNTAYSLRLVLLGGFVRMAGMEGELLYEEEDRGSLPADSYKAKAPWKRAQTYS